jgi:phage baseplate assembly protein W
MSQKEIAISLPFSFNSSGGISQTSDQRKIWQDRVVVAIMTSLNERVMLPNYGSTVQNAAFTSINDSLLLIKQAVAKTFSTWLPALNLKNIDGHIDPIDGYLVINVTYTYGNQSNNEQVAVKTAILSQSGDTYTEVTSVNNK